MRERGAISGGNRRLPRGWEEQVRSRGLVTINEAVGEGAEATKDQEGLTEVVRKSLTNVIARLFADQTGTVRGITIPEFAVDEEDWDDYILEDKP